MAEQPQGAPPEFKVRAVDTDNQEEFENFQIPTFTNYLGIWRHGQDVYLDVGLLTVEQLNTLTSKTGSEVTVAMHGRFVMSPGAFNDFITRAKILCEQLKAEGLTGDESRVQTSQE